MERHQIIAEKVQKRTARPSVNLTGLAHVLGISRQSLTRRLNGEVAWHYDELERLAQAFNMTVDQLISENEDAA